MAIETVPLTGKLTAPGSGGIAVRGTVAAFPNTGNGYPLSFSADNENTLGPVVGEVQADGTFELDIPVNSDQQASLYWTIVVKTSERVPGLNKTVTWTPGTFAIDAAVDLADLEAVAVTSVSATVLEDFATLVDEAQTARDEAAAFGGTNNEQVAGMVETPGPTKNALAATEPRTGFVMDNTSETVSTTYYPIGSIDGVVYGRHSSAGLYKTLDGGTTWTLVNSGVSPTGIHQLGDGEVLVNGSSNLKKSSGWATNPATATWSTVATANGTSTFIDSDLDVYDNIVIAAEYAVPRTDARYVKVSTDYGATFTNVRDLNTMFPGDEANTHWHAVCVDPFHDGANPRLWISHGDGPRGVYYSDNLGTSWTEYGTTNTWQPMPMVATEHGIVVSTDANDPDGIWLIPRDLSARVLLAAIPAAYWAGSLLGFGTAAKRDEATGIVYIFFRADQQAHFTESRKAMIFASDGKRATLIYETAQSATLGGTGSLAFEGLPALTSDGHLLATYQKSGTRYNVKGRVRRGTKSARASDPGNVLTGASTGRSSISIGYGTSARNQSVLIGSLAGNGMTSTNEGVVLVGEETVAAGTRATAVGYKSNSHYHGVAIGSEAVAGSESITIGSGATTTGRTGVIAIGRLSAVVGGENQVAIGYQARAEVGSSTALGSGAKAGNTATGALGSTAIGLNATATGDRSTCLGATTTATHQRSVALGHGTTTTNEWQVQVGARHFEASEVATEPGAPAVNAGRLYFKDNGAGKTQLCVRFNTGAVQILSTEP